MAVNDVWYRELLNQNKPTCLYTIHHAMERFNESRMVSRFPALICRK